MTSCVAYRTRSGKIHYEQSFLLSLNCSGRNLSVGKINSSVRDVNTIHSTDIRTAKATLDDCHDLLIRILIEGNLSVYFECLTKSHSHNLAFLLVDLGQTLPACPRSVN